MQGWFLPVKTEAEQLCKSEAIPKQGGEREREGRIETERWTHENGMLSRVIEWVG